MKNQPVHPRTKQTPIGWVSFENVNNANDTRAYNIYAPTVQRGDFPAVWSIDIKTGVEGMMFVKDLMTVQNLADEQNDPRVTFSDEWWLAEYVDSLDKNKSGEGARVVEHNEVMPPKNIS